MQEEQRLVHENGLGVQTDFSFLYAGDGLNQPEVYDNYTEAIVPQNDVVDDDTRRIEDVEMANEIELIVARFSSGIFSF